MADWTLADDIQVIYDTLNYRSDVPWPSIQRVIDAARTTDTTVVTWRPEDELTREPVVMHTKTEGAFSGPSGIGWGDICDGCGEQWPCAWFKEHNG